jgi:hypothetical protein
MPKAARERICRRSTAALAKGTFVVFGVRHCRTKSTEGRHRFARLCPAIHAEVALANASTGICPLQFSMDHRVKRNGSGVA